MNAILRVPVSLWRSFYLNRHARIEWKAPPKMRIAVFDIAGSEALIPLFGDEPYVIIPTRGERIHLTPGILWRTILNLALVRHPFAAYILALVQHIRPAIVATFVDNSSVYGIVAQHYTGARFVAVQNGIRSLGRDNPPGSRPIFHREFICFGQNEVDAYTRHGAKVERYHPAGSLRDSYYRQIYESKPAELRYDLCLVSEADPNLAQSYPEIEEAVRRLAISVAKFRERNQRTLCIAARNDPAENPEGFQYETQWYRDKLGSDVVLTPNNRKTFAAYRLLDSSAVGLAFCSTALVEAFGRGKRSLFCNFTAHDWYDMPVSGAWFLKEPSFEEFEQRLNELLSTSDLEFRHQSSDAAAYVMKYDERNPPHVLLRTFVAEALNRPAQNL